MNYMKNLPSMFFFFHKHIEPICTEILLGLLLFIYPGVFGNDLFVKPIVSTDEVNIWKRIFGIFLFALGVLHWAIMHLVANTDRDEKMNRFYKYSFAFIQKTIMSCEFFFLFAFSLFFICPWGEKQLNELGILTFYAPIIAGILMRIYSLRNLDYVYGR